MISRHFYNQQDGIQCLKLDGIEEHVAYYMQDLFSSNGTKYILWFLTDVSSYGFLVPE